MRHHHLRGGAVSVRVEALDEECDTAVARNRIVVHLDANHQRGARTASRPAVSVAAIDDTLTRGGDLAAFDIKLARVRTYGKRQRTAEGCDGRVGRRRP
eukprot:CAMPEP_0119466556 /NCGR_PEP_ID=MMETSP1344-20130328/1160_1 /TAXON_ID=236787 /ORGANISM="Florenciella parvula, Strain CCMP2471" /LENGTH=98 /DNA_ID=CAMNT_0007498881 /DNA_START=790 /DNA_END=1082 /DNA_ORIENTATION=+